MNIELSLIDKRFLNEEILFQINTQKYEVILGSDSEVRSIKYL